MEISAWVINPKKIISKLERVFQPRGGHTRNNVCVYGGPRQKLFLTCKYPFIPKVCCSFFIHKIKQQISTCCVLQISTNISILKEQWCIFYFWAFHTNSHMAPHAKGIPSCQIYSFFLGAVNLPLCVLHHFYIFPVLRLALQWCISINGVIPSPFVFTFFLSSSGTWIFSSIALII